MKPCLVAVLLILLPPVAGGSVIPPGLTTRAEQSGFRITGRFDEVVALCDEFPRVFPKKARCERFGTTPEGRPMVALLASADGTLEPALARARHRPVLFFQGGIHAGEIDGKDAGFLAMRELLEGKAAPGALEKVTVVFVPVLNVDGHERFGPHNRPNQVGPEEMGWRTTAQNLNLNRDYVKADSPEMAALLGLLNAWDPVLYADLHVTDGADFQIDLSVTVIPTNWGPKRLREAASEARDGVLARLSEAGHKAVSFYPSFRKDDDPLSGFDESTTPLRFSHAYWGARNRIGILVETHSWKPYDRRVRSTHDTFVGLVALGAKDGAGWQAAALAADREEAAQAGKDVALSYDVSDKTRPLAFPGYAFQREPSPVSGAIRIRYDASRPQTWKVPFHYEVKPKLVRAAPRVGYVVPAAHAEWVRRKLVLHGIGFETWEKAREGRVQAFRATDAEPGKKTYEGRTQLAVKGAWAEESRSIPAGSLFVPIAQPKAALVMQLFEPDAPDSLVTWGFFNAAFERKEYMEPYVAEIVAEKMLEDPKVKSEFTARLESDPEFAKDPEKRLDFFYRRHPSWDERFRLYPIYRLEAPVRDNATAAARSAGTAS